MLQRSEAEVQSLPSGTITFLFTDVEGSTRLWQEDPARMKVALAGHHARLQQAIEEHRGYTFQIVGDAFHAAFSTAPAALAAALEAQRALQEQGTGAAPPSLPAADGPVAHNSQVLDLSSGSPPLRVRMALHTGPAEVHPEDLRSGQYASSMTLSLTARLLSAAHGGQILLSAAAEELARDQLPPGGVLRDLGVHRLRDLVRPQHIFQLSGPGLPDEFPPLNAANETLTNIPIQLTSFVGRARELAEVKGLLAGTRLLTLTGTGGTGKTRLALQVASEVLDEYPDGAWLVELAQLSDPGLVLQAIASALGVREQQGHALLDMLRGYLLARNLLLVIDNCEHLLDACVVAVTELQTSVPGLTVLTTSREPLGVAGEVTYRVPSLSLPEPGRKSKPEQLLQYEAVRLFVERARAVLPGFELSEQNVAAITKICRRLDGIPLAIELAAARMRVLSAEQIAARLDDHFKLLTGGSRSALPRQQTLQALVDWSYNLLSDAECVLLRRLSVFAGGWSLEAAEQIAGFAPTDAPAASRLAGQATPSDVEEAGLDVLDLLARLVDRSLVLADTQAGEARYRLLEMIRQYAREKLQAAGKSTPVRDRHLQFYLSMVQRMGGEFMGWERVDLLVPEEDNLRTALEWATATRPLDAVRLGSGLIDYWVSRGLASEGRRRLSEALQESCQEPLADDEESELRGRICARGRARLGYLHYAQGDYLAARASLEESLPGARDVGARGTLCYALGLLGMVDALLGDFPAAQAAAGEALRLARALPDRRFLGFALYASGEVAGQATADQSDARALFAESLRVWRTEGGQMGEALAVWGLGMAAYRQGFYDEAADRFRESMTIRDAMHDRTSMNVARSALADVARQQGRFAESAALYRETLAQWRQIGNLGAVARCMECLGFLAAAQAEAQPPEARTGSEPDARLTEAARLLGAAQALRESGAASPMTAEETVEYERLVPAARALGDPIAFDAAWNEGCTMTAAEAVEYALCGDFG